MNSLKQQLNQLIRLKGEVTHREIQEKCENGYFGKKYRISNAERRLRQSESPNVEAIIQDGAIKKYRWVGAPQQYKTYRVLDFEGKVEKTIRIPI